MSSKRHKLLIMWFHQNCSGPPPPQYSIKVTIERMEKYKDKKWEILVNKNICGLMQKSMHPEDEEPSEDVCLWELEIKYFPNHFRWDLEIKHKSS